MTGLAAAVLLAAEEDPTATVGDDMLLGLTIGSVVLVIVLIASAKLHPLNALIAGAALMAPAVGAGSRFMSMSTMPGFGWSRNS